MKTTNSLMPLAALAAANEQLPVQNWPAPRPSPSSRIWPAQVVTRWAGGCHIRVADEYDTILPADALPEDTDRFGVRITPEGALVLSPA